MNLEQFEQMNWKEDYDTLISWLRQGADGPYRQFTAKLMPNISIDRIIGVRLPLLRKVSKKIAKGKKQQYLEAFVERYVKVGDEEKCIPNYEEVLLCGFVIGTIDVFSEAESYIRKFIPLIDNWSTCDSFCNSLKLTKQNQEEMYQLVLDYLHSGKEYEIRFGVVMLLNYYINAEYIERVFQEIATIQRGEYYVRMACGWTIATCYCYDSERTLRFLKEERLDDDTYHCALQKIIESTKVAKEEKQIIRQMKRGKS